MATILLLAPSASISHEVRRATTDAVAAPVTTDHLVVDDVLATPIIAPPSSRGIAPQPAARGIAPLPAITSRRRPPPPMESTTSPPPPRINLALYTNYWRRLSQRRFFFFFLSSHNSHLSFSLLKNTHKGKKTQHTHTHFTVEKASFAMLLPVRTHTLHCFSQPSRPHSNNKLYISYIETHAHTQPRPHRPLTQARTTN